MSDLPDNNDLSSLDNLAQRMGQDAHTALPPVAPRVAPGYLNYMPPLIKEIWNQGASFTLDGTTGAVMVDGFYRNGPMKIEIRDAGAVAIDKRNRETAIVTFQDLVDLNFQFWRQANSIKGTYVQPQRPWLDHFLATKKVKRQVLYVPADEGDGSAEG